MSDINLGQFLTNVFSATQNTSAQQTRSAMLGAEQSQNSQQIQKDIPTETLFPNATAQLAKTVSELSELNQKQTAEMLKELLNMPKDIEQLLSRLSAKTSAENLKTAMFLLSSTLDIIKLSAMLNNASKEAKSNLYQMIANFNQLGVSLKDEQISLLTKMISVVSSSTSSDVQSIKTVIQMYLPWLPLTEQDAFKLEIAKKNGFDVSDSDDDISILIATDNYGNVQGIIAKIDTEGIRVDVTTSKTFPVQEIKDFLNEDSKKYSININYTVTPKESFDREKVKSSKTKVFMNSGPGINPFLIMISCDFIRHIHDIDARQSLREQRKEI